MDQAGWHISNGLVVKDNLAIMYLPPYSPDLNPAEHFWDYIREKKGFNNNVFNSLQEVENKLSIVLNDIENNIEEIKSLSNFKWISYIFCVIPIRS